MSPRAIRLVCIAALSILIVLGAIWPEAVFALGTGAIGVLVLAVIYGCRLCLESTDDDREDL